MGRPADRLAAGLVALPCLLLLALSLLSARAAFVALPHDHVFDEVSSGRGVKADRLEAAANANLEAATWFESARYRTIGASALFAASRAGAKIPLETIERPIRQSLASQPVSPFNWMRLAFLRFGNGDSTGAARAWEMSVETGRLKPAIMATRLALGLRLLETQSPAFEALVREQILVMAKTNPLQLARFAHDTSNGAAVRAALADDASARAAFEQAMRQVRGEELYRLGIWR